MSTKLLKLCYFVIYDQDDNIIAYLDSYEEIIKFCSRDIKKIANEYDSCYFFKMDGKIYKLIAFCD